MKKITAWAIYNELCENINEIETGLCCDSDCYEIYRTRDLARKSLVGDTIGLKIKKLTIIIED